MNILARMLAMLTSAYNKSDEYNVKNDLEPETFIGRMLAVVNWGFGLIQDNADRIRLWSDIDHASGVVLDRHGKNFGVARGGANDVFYRLLIKTKILAQISGGDIETIISAVSGLYQIPADRIELHEIFPAKVQIAIFEDDLPESYEDIKDLVGALTKRLLAGGVGLDMIYKEEDETLGHLFIGGHVVSEFTRIRLANHEQAFPEDITGVLYAGGRVVSELTRVRLTSQSV